MEDPGSTQDFVTHDLAEKLHLPGHYQSGGRTRRGHTNESLQDVSIGHAKQKLQVEAICMDSLLAIYKAPETEHLASRFPGVDHHGRAAFRRPHGEVQLILGTRALRGCTP